MPDAYVMRTCAACKHYAGLSGPEDYGPDCFHEDVPSFYLTASQAQRWGCILFESKLPADPAPTD